MSDRNWLHIAALGGLTAVCLSSTVYAADPHGVAKPANQKPAQAAAAPRKATAPSAPAQNRAPYKPRCEAPKDHDAASFCQEARALEVAKQQIAIGWASFVLSLAGLIALVVTIIYTARAARAADTAAEAAQASVEDARADAEEQERRFTRQLEVSDHANQIAREMGQRQARAYVHVDKARTRWNADAAYFHFICKNSGQTPATFYEIGFVAEVVPKMAGVAHLIPDDLEYVAWSALAGGTEAIVLLHTVPEDKIRKSELLPDNSMILSLRGRLRYGDIFGEVFESEFTFFTRHEQLALKDPAMGSTSAKLKVYQKAEYQGSKAVPSVPAIGVSAT